MGGSLFLDLEQYGDAESQAIAELAAREDDLASGWTFIKNRRSLAQYRQYLAGERRLRRSLSPRKWDVSAY
jgi:hypothetical protein